MPETIAVTGASGHIGNVVCRMLLEKGFNVRALYQSDSRSLEGLAVTRIKGSVMDHKDLERLMTGCTIVIHCAAIISIHGDPGGLVWQTNTVGPVRVFEVAQQLGLKKMLHLSSVHAVMEAPLTGTFDETRPYKTAAAFAYDYSKSQGEQLLLAAAKDSPMAVVMLRPSSVIGPFDFKPSEMGKALLDFYAQKIPVLPEGGYDFVDVRDVAASILAAMEQGADKEVYLLSGKYHSMRDLAQCTREVTGKKVPGVVIPFWCLKLVLPLVALFSRITGAAPLYTIESITALKNGHANMDHSKARRVLGHQNRALTETLRDFYAWQKSKTA